MVLEVVVFFIKSVLVIGEFKVNMVQTLVAHSHSFLVYELLSFQKEVLLEFMAFVLFVRFHVR